MVTEVEEVVAEGKGEREELVFVWKAPVMEVVGRALLWQAPGQGLVQELVFPRIGKRMRLLTPR
jgi:hypothetical protein